MKVLLVYPPFCTPASPPYSLVKLYGFLKNNLKNFGKNTDIEILDLNVFFHNQKWKGYGDFFRSFTENYDSAVYEKNAK
ncbi:hypothetical protein HYX13_03035, partial [Candidatus Woesearchaeota archaeon]|nr:hypothetical protein [Candidatus Woesearchaeota archaeon]